MVKDLSSIRLGNGEEREKQIVAGDLAKNADVMALLGYHSIENKRVWAKYFSDFMDTPNGKDLLPQDTTTKSELCL